MNEQQSIAKTIVQWTPLAETGEDKPELEGVDCDCYLCQYSFEITGYTGAPAKCRPCPYHKKYGQCFNREGMPYSDWYNAKSKVEKRIHATAFLAQVKTLQEKPMDDKKELEHRLKQAKIDRDKINSEVQILEQELRTATEPEKPKPWDIIEWTGKKASNTGANLVLHDGVSQIRIRDGVKGTLHNITPNDEFRVLFNLTDDLAALSGEPLEEFKMDRLKVTVGASYLNIEDADDFESVQIGKEVLHDFILNLRRMELKMIMDAAK